MEVLWDCFQENLQRCLLRIQPFKVLSTTRRSLKSVQQQKKGGGGREVVFFLSPSPPPPPTALRISWALGSLFTCCLLLSNNQFPLINAIFHLFFSLLKRVFIEEPTAVNITSSCSVALLVWRLRNTDFELHF